MATGTKGADCVPTVTTRVRIIHQHLPTTWGGPEVREVEVTDSGVGVVNDLDNSEAREIKVMDSGVRDDVSRTSSPAPSIFSDIYTESMSSQSSVTETMTAAEQFAKWLLEFEDLRLLYHQGINDPNIGCERFCNNFRRLFKIYGKDLLKEGKNEAERMAAQFALSESRRIAGLVRVHYYSSTIDESTITKHISLSDEERRARIEGLL